MKSIDEIKRVVSKYAPSKGVKSVQLFGSYADNRATENSDVDLLVEYDGTPSLFDYYGFQEQVKNELGVEVDQIRYPIRQEQILFPSFKIRKVIPLYG